MNLGGARILVTGGHGFLGRAVVREVERHGPAELRVPARPAVDLREREACRVWVKGVDLVIHLAARVGGIGLNQAQPGTLFYDNLVMGVELLEAARLFGVAKFVTVGTVCAYPKHTPVPFSEDDLWDGYPEETNAAYGIAKKALLVQGQAYRAQYGLNAIFLLPANLYGPGDNLDPATSHVIPAVIRTLHEAERTHTPAVTLWGSGNATREFLYVDDAARGIVLAAVHYDDGAPVNLGSGAEISIRDLASRIAGHMGFAGAIHFDGCRPDGQPRRCLDTRRAAAAFGFRATTDLDAGLRATIAWARGALGGGA